MIHNLLLKMGRDHLDIQYSLTCSKIVPGGGPQGGHILPGGGPQGGQPGNRSQSNAQHFSSEIIISSYFNVNVRF